MGQPVIVQFSGGEMNQKRLGSHTVRAMQAEQQRDAAATKGPEMANEQHVTPLVRRIAEERGVVLASVKGTGVGGRIRQADVLAAVSTKPVKDLSDDQLFGSLFGGGSPAGGHVAAATSSGKVMEFGSRFNNGQRVSYDPWGPNPLVEDLKQSSPAGYAAASKEAPVPTMFASGSLPAFTASGVDPKELMKLPWTIRHAAAADSNRARVMQLFEEHSDDPDAQIRGVGMEEYIARVRNWAYGPGHKPATTYNPADYQ